jgi:hypothetical protein
MYSIEGSNAHGIGRVGYGEPFHNPLLLPEILALVFSYLDAVDLARVSKYELCSVAHLSPYFSNQLRCYLFIRWATSLLSLSLSLSFPPSRSTCVVFAVKMGKGLGFLPLRPSGDCAPCRNIRAFPLATAVPRGRSPNTSPVLPRHSPYGASLHTRREQRLGLSLSPGASPRHV